MSGERWRIGSSSRALSAESVCSTEVHWRERTSLAALESVRSSAERVADALRSISCGALTSGAAATTTAAVPDRNESGSLPCTPALPPEYGWMGMECGHPTVAEAHRALNHTNLVAVPLLDLPRQLLVVVRV